MIQPFYLVAQATSDGNGNVTLTFPQLTQSLTYTGSISVAVNLQQISIGYATNAPLRTARATWTVINNGQPVLNFLGVQVVKNFQASGRNQIVINGFGTVPGTPVIATWQGWTDNSAVVAPIGPEVTGGGIADITAGSPVENVFQSPVSFHAITVAPGTTTALVGTGLGNGYWQLLSYTLGISMSQLSTTTGTRSCDIHLRIHGTSTDIALINAGTIPATTSNEMIAENWSRNPITIGPVASSGIDLVASPTGADQCKIWASCLIMAI